METQVLVKGGTAACLARCGQAAGIIRIPGPPAAPGIRTARKTPQRVPAPCGEGGNVRRDSEWDAAHIDGAVHVPLHDDCGRL